MYSYEDRIRAVRLYIDLGKREGIRISLVSLDCVPRWSVTVHAGERSGAMDKSQDLSKLLEELPTMDRPSLSKLWVDCFGEAPTGGLSLSLMPPVLAFQLQSRAYGLSINLARQNSSSEGPEGSHQQRSLYRPGTVIVREWNGEIHEVQVTSEGYRYQGEDYRSLSPIANRITGTRWSGPMFFGTKRKGQGR